MADKSDRKSLRKRRGRKGQSDEDKLNKDETEVAKYLRWNLTTKKTVMYGDEVYYFTGSKIVDFMLDSKWATGKAKKSSIKFTDRESTYPILDKMIALGLFSRVHRTYKEKEKKGKAKTDEKKKLKEDNTKAETKPKDVEQSPKSDKKEKSKDTASKDSKEGKKKKKVKVSLEPHEQNIFIDTDDAVFIWIYDPVHPKTFFLGILLVIGAIAVCLFPLWPESFRAYSWYLSVLAMVFIGLILFLAIFRYIIFGFLWSVTFGKLHFWLLPNLTADCGFVESFIPLYEYTVSKVEGGDKGEKSEEASEEKEQERNDQEEKEDKSKLKEEQETNEEERDEKEDKEKDGTKADDSSGTGSASNKENDGAETWVKVRKSDAERNSNSEDETNVKC